MALPVRPEALAHNCAMTAPPDESLDQLRQQAEAQPANADAWMRYGAALHTGGRPELALVAFEKALLVAPGNVNAVSACATVLFELGRPQAAWQVLSTAREQLLASADGAANLGIAAEACGRTAEAQACFEHALALDANHVRALNMSGLLAANQARWELAIHNARRCVELVPGEPALWVNLADMLTGGRQYDAALEVLDMASARFPKRQDVEIRHVVLLAFNAEFDRSEAALAALGPQGPAMLRDYLQGVNEASDLQVKKSVTRLPTMRELYSQQAFEAMQVCNWRYEEPLTAALRYMLAEVETTGTLRDWRDAQFYGIALPLHEDEIARIRNVSTRAIRDANSTAQPYAPPRRPAPDGRMRIGLAAQTLRDPRFANALARQLSLHDASRFAIYIYAPTPSPEARLHEALLPHAAGVVEIAHMSDGEAVGRMRLDQLDLFMDMAFNTPWCRPEIPERRVAPVQIRQLTWHRHHPARPCEYNMSDTFVHPDASAMDLYGAVVRLPSTCWLAANDDLPGAPATRADAGLPDDALVLCAFLPTVMIDPQSFALWMQVLRALPDAVLWLPSFGAQARANLQREATAAGVNAERLVFAGNATRPELLARLSLADLFVDSLRFNANHGLVDALRMGVPAMTCAGNSMGSRLGGSIVRAAGLPECVHTDPRAYRDAIIAAGRDRAALQSLRTRLAAALPDAPLFDTVARVREWETAWTMMIERHRAGLPPVAFDVPAPHQAAPRAQG